MRARPVIAKATNARAMLVFIGESPVEEQDREMVTKASSRLAGGPVAKAAVWTKLARQETPGASGEL